MSYKLILADPPWRYSNSGVNGAASNHYPTMSNKEILSLPVESLAHNDCVLVLWATWPFLEVAMQVIPSWGFKYKTGFPWVKINKAGTGPIWGTGWWVRGCTEPILIGVRGKAKYPERQWLGLLSNRLKHSKKPEHIYQYCESFPGPYLELFAREKRTGWDSWGNEVNGDSTVQIRNNECR